MLVPGRPDGCPGLVEMNVSVRRSPQRSNNVNGSAHHFELVACGRPRSRRTARAETDDGEAASPARWRPAGARVEPAGIAGPRGGAFNWSTSSQTHYTYVSTDWRDAPSAASPVSRRRVLRARDNASERNSAVVFSHNRVKFAFLNSERVKRLPRIDFRAKKKTVVVV